MDKLVIPKSCVIQGEAQAISCEGDIDIQNRFAPKTLHSGNGGIRFVPEGQDVQCQKIVAEQGLVEIETGDFSCGRIAAKGAHLKTRNFEVDQLSSDGELFLNASSVKMGECRADRIDLKADSVVVDAIHSASEITFLVDSIKAQEIHAKRVVIHGSLECKRLVATESVVVESGKVAIKMLDCPSFHAAGEVTGIVMIANSDDVKAEGVRGFLHPSELGMLAEDQDVISIPTADLSAMAVDEDEDEDTAPGVDDVVEEVPTAVELEPAVEVEDPPPAVELESAVEVDDVPEEEPEAVYEETLETETTENLRDPFAPVDTLSSSYDLDEEESEEDELTSEIDSEDLEEVEDFGATAIMSPQAIADAMDDPLEDVPGMDDDAVLEVPDLDGPEFDASGLDDPGLDDADLGEPQEADAIGDGLDDMGVVSEDLEELDDLPSVEITGEDLEDISEPLDPEPLEPDPLPEPVQDPEDVLAADLRVILDQISGFFPNENIPSSIGQIERYLEERRFSLFAKQRNKEAVLTNFDKFQHEEISRLIRSFFQRVDDYFQDV